MVYITIIQILISDKIKPIIIILKPILLIN